MGLFRTKVKQGWLEGIDCGAFAVYRGIPFAQPPVGKLRFQPPEPGCSWKGVRKANEYAKVSWQEEPEKNSFYEREFYREDWCNTDRSEDCLYLNIWTPAQSSKEHLSVLLWIHGGAFQHGYGHEIEFDGEAFCRKDVILVTIQYRLGIFGFLSHPWFENKWEGSGNLALLDQIAALDWVYNNIEAFGGDTGNITVAGQSAGGISVQALVTSPLTKGKISKAIMQSGGGQGQLAKRCITCEKAMKSGERIVKACSIRTPEELYKMEACTLLKMTSSFPCRLVMDDYVLMKDETDQLCENYPAIPYLMGSTENDIRVTSEMLEKGLHSDLYLGNMEFAKQINARRENSAYLYYFTRKLPGDNAGAFHSSELWYMFGTLGRSWRPFSEEDYRLSEIMVEYWSRFVKTGIPGKEIKEWPSFTQQQPYIKIFT